MERVPVVDDEPSILALLAFNLEKGDYQVTTSEDGKNGFELAPSNQYDSIVLDIMLLSMDGLETTKAFRREKVDTPILILATKDEQVDKIIGLGIGADDYLAKPFNPKEVLARMKAIFRCLKPTTTETLQEDTPRVPFVAGEICVDEQNYEVFARDQPIELTPKEFELFVYLMKRKGRVINRETLLERIWQYDFAGQSHIADVHISHLHDKIEFDPRRPVYLVIVRGFGYRPQEPKQ